MAYNFCVRSLGKIMGVETWRMVWVVDHYYSDSRLRYPRTYSRETEDFKAVARFCRKHKIDVSKVALGAE